MIKPSMNHLQKSHKLQKNIGPGNGFIKTKHTVALKRCGKNHGDINLHEQTIDVSLLNFYYIFLQSSWSDHP